jgi:hypothetical protein
MTDPADGCLLGGVAGMGTATVLVVDDERKIRDTVRLFLEQQRFAVLLAASGEQALDIAGRLKPDLVVLDLMLPGEEVALAADGLTGADHHAHCQGRGGRPGGACGSASTTTSSSRSARWSSLHGWTLCCGARGPAAPMGCWHLTTGIW